MSGKQICPKRSFAQVVHAFGTGGLAATRLFGISVPQRSGNNQKGPIRSKGQSSKETTQSQLVCKQVFLLLFRFIPHMQRFDRLGLSQLKLFIQITLFFGFTCIHLDGAIGALTRHIYTLRIKGYPLNIMTVIFTRFKDRFPLGSVKFKDCHRMIQ